MGGGSACAPRFCWKNKLVGGNSGGGGESIRSRAGKDGGVQGP